jgi:hypothetical protein
MADYESRAECYVIAQSIIKTIIGSKDEFKFM